MSLQPTIFENIVSKEEIAHHLLPLCFQFLVIKLLLIEMIHVLARMFFKVVLYIRCVVCGKGLTIQHLISTEDKQTMWYFVAIKNKAD